VYLYASNLDWDAVSVFRNAGRLVHCMASLDALIGALLQEARAGDHVLIMSNGAFGGIHARLLSALAAKEGR